jgi:hypothetical protein
MYIVLPSTPLLAAQNRVGLKRQALGGVLGDDPQHPNLRPDGRSPSNKIHSPAVFGPRGRALSNTLLLSALSDLLCAYDQPFFGIETMDALNVCLPNLSLE